MTVEYLNGQTALDWIRMGYLNELIAKTTFQLEDFLS